MPHHLVHVRISGARRHGTGVDEQVLDGFVKTVHLDEDVSDDLAMRIVVGHRIADDLNRPADTGEGVLYFVGERSRELAHLGELLGAGELGLHRRALRRTDFYREALMVAFEHDG